MNVFPDPTAMLLAVAALLALSGLPGLVRACPRGGQRFSAFLVLGVSALGETAVVKLLTGTPGSDYLLEWPIPLGPVIFSVDPLSGLFLLPLFLVTAAAGIYGLGYWPAAEKPSAGRLGLFSGLFAAAMVIVVLARSVVPFLMAWEIMALSAYFLVTVEPQQREAQRVGTVYLIATHTGTVALLVMFSLLREVSGSYAFPALHTLPRELPWAGTIVLAALIGFGGKAGLMPLHFWLPGAHANAPSHVSAMMSGLMLKMGIYGILRTVSFFVLPPPWLGWLLLVLGAWSAVNGIALASGQRDLKRLLACSSIENIGIVFIGIGLALVGMTSGSAILVACGLCGAFMHIINHALCKSLLFFGSGALIHATGSREIDRMGGLARKLPRTCRSFLLGAVAICGLPPLNGFVGELYLYTGAFMDGITAELPLLALVVPVLALVGGLAVITFVKLFGIVFLGEARSAGACSAHEGGGLLAWPMVLLAAACLLTGVVPQILLWLVTPATAFFGSPEAGRLAADGSLVPLTVFARVNGALLLLVALLWVGYRLRLRQTGVAAAPTWGCGYPAPTPRMQYTGTSFSEQLVNLLGVFALPHRRFPCIAGIMPAGGVRFGYEVREAVLDRLLIPLLSTIGLAFSYLRRLQHGQVHLYMLYIFATLFVLMLSTH